MASVVCKSCGRTVYGNLNECPYCHTPLNITFDYEKNSENVEHEKSKNTLIVIISLVIIIVLWIISSMMLSRFEEQRKVSVEKEKIHAEQAKYEAKLHEFKQKKEEIISNVNAYLKVGDTKSVLWLCNQYIYTKDKDIQGLVQKAKLLNNNKVQELLSNKKYNEAMLICNDEMAIVSKNLIQTEDSLCQVVIEPVDRDLCRMCYKTKDKFEVLKQVREEQELKASMGPRAWKLHKKHPEWSVDDCKNVAKSKYWIGMTTEMMVASMGRPDSAKPSNYGNGRQWQYCYTDGWFQCLYDQNDDGIIDSYN